MTSSPSTAALEPVRQRLRRDAEDEAARLRAAAHAQADAIVAEAQRDAKATLAAVAAQAAATADPLTSAELRRARGAARSAVLTAQRAACDELRSRVRAGVGALRTQPGYEQLLHRITVLAEQAAGPDAEVTPAPSGGVIARRPGLVIDCSLDRLADLAVTSLGAEVAELWAP
ncbi:MAG TPA: V-type ATP synthase subunit E family protein [Streptosporangiaceae bacterium]|nr:V-type ATP synthase subunit E family protein [Streptosporangiaceae bacterium]